ncbi:MAG: DUF3810 domain-containing protein [Clostridia bacterium]|nr:DUF3810 domain-containing protein [Clostridia bacterium]
MESRNQEINNEFNNETVFFEEAEINSASFEIEGLEEESQDEMKTEKRAKLFNAPFIILVSLFVLSIIIYTVSRFVPAFAEIWTRYPAQLMRLVLAKLTGWIPFSFAETVIVTLPITVTVFIVGVSVSTKRNDSKENFYKWLRPIISVILVILTLFFAAFGPAYGRYSLSQNLKLDRKDVSVDELFATGIIVSAFTNLDVGEIDFDSEGASVMPYGFDVLVEKMNQAYRKYTDGLDYISHFDSSPKPIALSEPMTYTHISGVYTYMTGEANINVNYPDFLIPFTVAHEMAHQRGIAREDEANFVAFLVCTYSDDAYIRYSGYANMLNYINSALGKSDKEKGKELFQKYTPYNVQLEFAAYSEFFDKYRESTASKVSGTINNAYLQSQGQTAGTKSYGLVVDLAVAYYKRYTNAQ